MIHVTVNQTVYQVEQGTTLAQLAKVVQKPEESEILLAYADGKLKELFYPLVKDSYVRFVTLEEQAGYMTYKRTAMFMFFKACEDVLGKGAADDIAINYSIGNSTFCEFLMDGVTVDKELADKIQRRMQELYKADLSIEKKSVDTSQARKYFAQAGLREKQRLFRFRRESRTNIYSLDGYDNYFYGYMAPSTGYIGTFLVSSYQDGMVLQTPKRHQTEEIARFYPQPKLFRVMQRSREWCKTLGVDTVGALNEVITEGKTSHLILLQEGLQEKLLSDIADKIVQQKKRIVLIAGPSSSGKTSFSHRLSIQLRANGLMPHAIAVDNYFVNRDQSPRDEFGNYNFENL